MKNNQFSIIKTSHQQKIAELTHIGFLSSDSNFANSKELWQHFLQLSFPQATTASDTDQFLANLLATPDENLSTFLQSYTPLATDNFYLVALQLLQFEPKLDFDIHEITKSMETIQLPFFHS